MKQIFSLARCVNSNTALFSWSKNMLRFFATVVLVLASGAWMSSAHAVDWQVFAGHGDRANVKKAGLGLVWDIHEPLLQGQSWQLRLLHEAQLAYWNVRHASDIFEVGYTPMFRMQWGAPGSDNWSPFMEAGIGVRLLSHTRLSPDTTMSSAFQFSDTIGAGIQFGNQGRFTVGVRYQHLSNAGLKKPNPGINFTQVYFQQRF